jgi:prepilin-type N-terminal cleavage/methylation domain-containing protein/prepilin-type processing-associated H-X9-DG protein
MSPWLGLRTKFPARCSDHSIKKNPMNRRQRVHRPPPAKNLRRRHGAIALFVGDFRAARTSPRGGVLKGFTLLELLIVVTLIAILAALVLPALSRTKENARQTNCASNLRQIALGVFLYADEHEDRFPDQPGDGRPVRAAGGDGRNYYDLLMPVLSNPHVWDCPSANRIATGDVGYMSYHMNGQIITTNGLNAGAVSLPWWTLLMNDAGEKRRWDRAFLRPDQNGGYSYDLPISNHRGGGNVAFVDGHVAWVHDSRWNPNSFRETP